MAATALTMAVEPVPKTERAPPPRILVVDDERSMRELLAIVLRRDGYDVILAENGRTALGVLEREPFDLLISDIKMPDMSGVEVLRAAKQIDQDILGIMITAFASTDTAIEAMRLGAHDYLSKPFDVDELKINVRNALERAAAAAGERAAEARARTTHQFSNIVGRSDAMLAVFKLIETDRADQQHGAGDRRVRHGQGAGRARHSLQLAAPRPAVRGASTAARCPSTLLESELFGHMRGAFTGAAANKKGLDRSRPNGARSSSTRSAR